VSLRIPGSAKEVAERGPAKSGKKGRASASSPFWSGVSNEKAINTLESKPLRGTTRVAKRKKGGRASAFYVNRQTPKR